MPSGAMDASSPLDGAGKGVLEHTPMGSSSVRRRPAILVVDDEPAITALVADILGAQARILCANDCDSAVKHATAAADSLRLLIADVVLPGSSGRAVAMAVQAVRPGLPVLYMSGYAESSDSVKDFPPPGSDFLRKPFPPDVLRRTVKGIIDRPASARLRGVR